MPEIIQRSFVAGELSPSLQARADFSKYAAGLNLCENFFVRAQGGVYSRPGFKFLGELDDMTKEARLKEFEFNTEQTYILVFEEYLMRVMKDGGFVLDGASPFEIVTPYSESDLPDLYFTQSADVMTICHRDYDPRNLSRLADDNWTLTVIDYSPTVSSPSFTSTTSKSISDINLLPILGTVTITTSTAHGFATGNVVSITGVVGTTELNGRVFEITVVDTTSFTLDDVDGENYTEYVSGGIATKNSGIVAIGSGAGSYEKTYYYKVTAVDENGVESLPSSVASITTDSLSTTAGVRLTWAPVSGADYYRVYKDPSVNTNIFGWIGDSKTVSFDDYNIAPITSDAPPEDRTPFDGTDNKPGVVNYYQQRQLFANTNNEPQTLFTTQTANYASLRTSTPARDDDAITLTIAGQKVNEIRHIVAINSLILLTSGAEWKVTEGQEEVFTPSTIGVRPQSYNGASKVVPVVVNSTVIYVQEKGGRLRDFGYEFVSDNYTGNDLSLMAEHLFDGNAVVTMAYAAEPYSIVWCVMEDGTLLGLTYQREHKVWAWHRHTTDGYFEDIATVSEDGRNALYAIIRRTINGSTVRYIERLEAREQTNVEDCFYVDCGLTYSGTAATVISGLDHLEGEEVVVLADGNEVTGLTVESGSITLPREAETVHVGLPYLPVIETLDIDVASVQETIRSKSLSVSKVCLDVEKSRGGWVGPKEETYSGYEPAMYEIKPRFDSDGYDATSLKTFKETISIDPMWSKGAGIRIEQRSPLPLAILSITPDVDLGGN